MAKGHLRVALYFFVAGCNVMAWRVKRYYPLPRCGGSTFPVP
jgi:hypothetical protein